MTNTPPGRTARPTQLERIAGAIPPDALLNFMRILTRSGERRVALARVCADRALAEGLPGNLDLAIGELRFGR